MSTRWGVQVKDGWIPSRELHYYADDPHHVMDSCGELLTWEEREAGDVRALIDAVNATEVDPDAVAGRAGGFSSWQDSLSSLSDHDLITALAEAEHTARISAARQVALVAEFASRREGTYWIGGRARGGPGEFTADHLALAAGVSARSMENRITEAERLRAYPRIQAAFGSGLISAPGVRAFLQEVTCLDTSPHSEDAAAVETLVLDHIGRPRLPGLAGMTVAQVGELAFADVVDSRPYSTPGQLTRWTRAAVVTVDADAARTRGKTRDTPRMEFQPAPTTGLTLFGAWLPDAQAAAGWERVDSLACQRHADGDTAGDEVGLDEVRTQVFYDLLMTNGFTAEVAVPVNVHVLIDAAGNATTPRVGAISPRTLADLTDLAERSGGRVTTTTQPPVTCPGMHPNGGRGDPYEVPAAVRRTIQLRDQECRYPGCTRPATACDVDHTVPWPQGPTCPCNLSALCRSHHRLKTHDPAWTLTNHGNGHLTWHTPQGDYPTAPTGSTDP